MAALPGVVCQACPLSSHTRMTTLVTGLPSVSDTSPATLVLEAEFVAAGQTVEVNGQTFEGPLHVVRRMTLKEISFVDSGADGGTKAVVAAGAMVLVGFVAWERHRENTGRQPLVHLRLFSIPSLRSGTWALLFQNMILMGIFFTIPLTLIGVIVLYVATGDDRAFRND